MAMQINKDVIIWVDSDRNVAKKTKEFANAGYNMKYCAETQDCIDYIANNIQKQRIVGIITSMMESGGRKSKGLKNGIEMIQYIQQKLLLSMLCNPIFAICSRSVDKKSCSKYGIPIIIKSSEWTNPRKEVQKQMITALQQSQQQKAVIIWVDSNPNVQHQKHLFAKEGYKLKYFGETQECINYIQNNKSIIKISGIITSMMRSGGRQQKGLKDGLQMTDYIRKILSTTQQKPIFAVVSSSADKKECKQHGINIIVRSWTEVKNQLLYQIVNINKINNNGDIDEKTVQTDFYSSCDPNTFKIKKVTNISSRMQEGIYEQILYGKCNEYKQKRKDIEKYAWHGSNYDGIQSILSKGFDRDFNTTSAYGRGTYFAKYAKKSTQYTPLNKDGYKYMLFCKIIVGKRTVGNSKLKQIPNNPNTNKPYDCMVDNVKSPTIFVVAKDYHAVPIYLVKFKE